MVTGGSLDERALASFTTLFVVEECVFFVGEIAEREHDLGVSDFDDVVVFEDDFGLCGDGSSVDDGSIGAVHIGEEVSVSGAACFAPDLDMSPGDHGVFDLDRDTFVSADDCFFGQGVVVAFTGARNNSEGSHGRYSCAKVRRMSLYYA